MVNTLNQKSLESPRPVTPLGILTEHLQAAAQLLDQETSVSADIKQHVQQALKLASGLDAYVETCTSEESPALKAIAFKTSQENWNQRFSDGTTNRHLEQEMLSGHVEGQALKMFVHMTRAQRVLDIGMFTGYSALAMAEALAEEGVLVACEVDPYVATFAQELFRESPHGNKIRVELGSALQTLNKLATAQVSFDLVFIDADKKEYVQYFQTVLDSNLLAPGGFICVDNTLLQGQPYLPPEERSENGEAIAQFNRVVAADPRVEQVLLPVRDGLTIIRYL
ncbi:class I SAM-dependent methyltransferase [Microcoleus sp. FACHB-SPT15]|uniref:O-methyltransferase n=1 Tax=Microcoleus sp. FACHB-SPT15 TaxID=2692830 RepID=UPI001780F4E3|nr:class I SAM-dependent methyltransferase [Microcoleus sp. FACHB-SPT15]MBD1804650.1 class I SAM-dependent methyltransferase [Microcoleus sp. FACHB-SPT15]